LKTIKTISIIMFVTSKHTVTLVGVDRICE